MYHACSQSQCLALFQILTVHPGLRWYFYIQSFSRNVIQCLCYVYFFQDAIHGIKHYQCLWKWDKWTFKTVFSTEILKTGKEFGIINFPFYPYIAHPLQGNKQKRARHYLRTRYMTSLKATKIFQYTSTAAEFCYFSVTVVTERKAIKSVREGWKFFAANLISFRSRRSRTPEEFDV